MYMCLSSGFGLISQHPYRTQVRGKECMERYHSPSFLPMQLQGLVHNHTRDVYCAYIFDFGIQFDFIMAIFFTVHDILHNTGLLSNSRTYVCQLLLGIDKMQDLRCYTLLTQITILWNMTSCSLVLMYQMLWRHNLNHWALPR